MIRKHAWYGLAFAGLGALAAACSSDDTTNGGSGTGGASGTGATAGTSPGGAGGTGGAEAPPRGANYDCSAPTGAAPTLTLTTIASGLTRPVFLTHAPNDSRLFVLEQDGLIKILEDGAVNDTPFLDVTDLVVRGSSEGDERGLLGLAFHPSYEQNGLFYIYHTQGTSPQQNVIAEYEVDSADPNLADSASRREILVIDDPASNHNGGTIEFGGDGFLYFGSGDGGGGDNQFNTTQNPSSLLGKVLRIDVDTRASGKEYGIPSGNMTTMPDQDDPSTQVPCEPEIWDFGLRNPYRFSFDGCTGDLYIGDVGQNRLEEINVEPAGTGHRNYGWSVTEGDDCFQATSCDTSGITFPVTTRPTGVAAAIQGGYVYRGAKMPGLRGTYFYGEYATGDIYALRWDGATARDVRKVPLSVEGALLSFGQDNDGEIYVLGNTSGTGNGTVYRIDPQ